MSFGKGYLGIEMSRFNVPTRTNKFDEEEIIEDLKTLLGDQITIYDPADWKTFYRNTEKEYHTSRIKFTFDVDSTFEKAVEGLKDIIERPYKHQKKYAESLKKYDLYLLWEYAECGGDFLTRNKLHTYWQCRIAYQHKKDFTCHLGSSLEFVDTVANRIRLGLINRSEYVDAGDSFYNIRNFILDNADDKNSREAKDVLNDPQRRNNFLKAKLKEPLLDAEVFTIDWSKY